MGEDGTEGPVPSLTGHEKAGALDIEWLTGGRRLLKIDLTRHVRHSVRVEMA